MLIMSPCSASGQTSRVDSTSCDRQNQFIVEEKTIAKLSKSDSDQTDCGGLQMQSDLGLKIHLAVCLGNTILHRKWLGTYHVFCF